MLSLSSSFMGTFFWNLSASVRILWVTSATHKAAPFFLHLPTQHCVAFDFIASRWYLLHVQTLFGCLRAAFNSKRAAGTLLLQKVIINPDKWFSDDDCHTAPVTPKSLLARPWTPCDVLFISFVIIWWCICLWWPWPCKPCTGRTTTCHYLDMSQPQMSSSQLWSPQKVLQITNSIW